MKRHQSPFYRYTSAEHASDAEQNRIEGLTDGIFAIVMTLLVLELKVPELERHASNSSSWGNWRRWARRSSLSFICARAIALEIYYTNQLMAGVLLGVQWEIVRRHGLLGDAITPGERISIPFRLWSIPVACVPALIAAFVRPECSLNTFALAAVAGRLISRRRERSLRLTQ